MTTQPTTPSSDASDASVVPQAPQGVGGAEPPSVSAEVAPAPVPKPTGIPVSSVGMPLECDPEALEPGMTVQLYGRPQFAGRVVGFVPMSGLDVQFCFVGKFKGSVAELSGKPFDGGQFLIAVVKNLTDKLMIARGCWYVQPNDPAAVKPATPTMVAPSATPAVAPAAPAAPVAQPISLAQLVHQQGPGAASTMPAPASVGPRGVTPGMNEVAILLQRGVAERLLRSIHGGAGEALHDSDKAPIERALQHALKGG